MRTVFGCMAFLALSVAAIGADGPVDAKLLVGKWEPAEPKKGPAMTIEFTDKGKLAMTVNDAGKEVKVDGSYTLAANKLNVVLKFGGEEVKHTLIIKKLTADELVTEDENGKAETLKRKK
jgi:uncharacterized protein (TIGR03066 family)